MGWGSDMVGLRVLGGVECGDEVGWDGVGWGGMGWDRDWVGWNGWDGVGTPHTHPTPTHLITDGLGCT
jgi:hypothetical protein